MSDRAAQVGRAPASAARPGRAARFDVREMPGFATIAAICIVGLYAPIAVLVVYSFNANTSVTIWKGFSLDWYVRAFENDQIRDAALLSIKVALIAAVCSTTFATMAALATTRVPPFRGLTAIYAVINQPLMVPEIVTGIATVVFFGLIRQTFNIQSIAFLATAHVVFCIPFAYLPIRARLEDMDRTYENAAADLYAEPWRAFRYVTLPLLVPGIIGGAMLAFLVSLDDVVITVMVAAAGETTLPLYVLGQVKRGVTPELNAMATMFLGASALLTTLFFLVTRKRAR